MLPVDDFVYGYYSDANERHFYDTYYRANLVQQLTSLSNPFEPLELYNLGDDSQEETNLSGSQRDIFQEMGRLLKTEMQKNGRVPW